jgi:acyl-coenzyme A thioesterase PaaI-like protein
MMSYDSAFAFACNSHGEPMVAAGASIEFLAPTHQGERVIASATETSRSERHGIYDVVRNPARRSRIFAGGARACAYRPHPAPQDGRDE